jgi:hypothetical protein
MDINRIGNKWEFEIESIGLVRNSNQSFVMEQTKHEKSVSITATLSTITEGLVLPKKFYNNFIASLTKYTSIRTNTDGSVVVDRCFDEQTGTINPLLPDLVITFANQNGYGVRILPQDYLRAQTSLSCRVQVVDGGENFLLGDSIIKSGYVELTSTRMRLCPNNQYHATDIAFDANANSKDRVKARGIEASPDADVITVSDDQNNDSSRQGLIIGITVGGITIVIGVRVYIVIRKKRRSKKILAPSPAVIQTSNDSRRYSASRSMIHDESSEVSETDVRV